LSYCNQCLIPTLDIVVFQSVFDSLTWHCCITITVWFLDWTLLYYNQCLIPRLDIVVLQSVFDSYTWHCCISIGVWFLDLTLLYCNQCLIPTLVTCLLYDFFLKCHCASEIIGYVQLLLSNLFVFYHVLYHLLTLGHLYL
jgi:hypothetical protein